MPPADLAERMARLRSEPVEVFLAIGVNDRNRVTGEWLIAMGWESGMNLTPRLVYRGKHWIECIVVKNGICVARSGEFLVDVE